jgi:predicted metal-dependent HD superfamily phosphohydrolase
MPDVARWRSTWMGLGVARPDEQLFAEVMGRYAEPHRSYHTTRHLDECLRRPALYHTEHFRFRYEAAARANLTRSIHQLES